ncbi:MAG: molybdopterin-synthase adenylyltransferase MoeB [Gammaproteobacteria bacterium]|nr:molybdopterin-synthase adenylyltransferase MoeB [Gammaproteobacteria bacterium]MYE99489.1 molybdopterin-synthase adenylyltransferase MoeB [Gammaproteobacteria bacterium]MYH86446.1 molybdopterin-synthase adenylyltransferase MoeB [Gammaproteobacteria bacterium]MYK05955.1 molybdopterin-synthase adenylyltransferase MoeB [Gammaproteobacteria bacterium]
MNEQQLLRFSRQIMLPEMDIGGQRKLMDASVLIIGMGGLGCPAAMYLAAAGVGRLAIADDDVVELTNLQRQIAHAEQSLGQAKVESARERLLSLNPDAEVTAINERLQGARLDEAVAGVDLVLDACDNFESRFAINKSCITNRKPLISAAAIRMQGQIAAFDPNDPASPCYQCLYPQIGELDTSCARNGVMAPLVGIIGSVQAMEAIKMITGIGRFLVGRLLLLDATAMQWRNLKLPRDAKCPACSIRA